MRLLIRRFSKEKSGATVVEYALIVAVLSLVIVGGVGQLANQLQHFWGDTDSKLNSAWTTD